ncbi:MAG: flap endonuclease, partial [Thermoplasmata archaeon]|nr:flap endonuclease [Thermoplasmata archaeon]
MMSRRRPPGDVGIAALRKILPPAPFDVAQLKGKTVAVDADNLVWSFVTALAGAGELPKAPDGRSNAHLLGLLSRLSLYAKWGARSVWVFDGVQPDLKEATLIERGERIEAARVAGDNYQASVAVDEDDLEECRTLLTALGQPWIVAPGESDAQCAHLVQAEKAWAAVTQDWDIALFGAPRALRNLTLSATRTPEILDLAVVLKTAGLTREQLVDAAILIGTDYNEGVSGVGPVKAVKLVKQGKKPEESGIANADEVRALYFAHPVDKKFTPKFGKPDAKATLAFLAERGIDE